MHPDVVRRMFRPINNATLRYALAVAFNLPIFEVEGCEIPINPAAALEPALCFRREWIRQKFLGFGAHSPFLPGFGHKSNHGHGFGTFGEGGYITHTASDDCPMISHPDIGAVAIVTASHISVRYPHHSLPEGMGWLIESRRARDDARLAREAEERARLRSERSQAMRAARSFTQKRRSGGARPRTMVAVPKHSS